jgi:hypothetical protein
MTRAIFEEAINAQTDVPDFVERVLERYGLWSSRKAKPIAAPVQIAGR